MGLPLCKMRHAAQTGKIYLPFHEIGNLDRYGGKTRMVDQVSLRKRRDKKPGVFYGGKGIHTIEAASHAASFPVHPFPTANY